MSHYFNKKQTSKEVLKVLKINFLGKDFQFNTSSGVFGRRKIDNGSKLLASKAKVKGKVLDLGCGYGFVGIFFAGDYDVTMSDVNQRAIRLCKENLKLNNVNAKIISSDGFSKIKSKFDTILLNPPQSAGKKVCLRLFSESFEHLKKNGFFYFVARHNKGGKSLQEEACKIFGNCDVFARGSGYRVYRCVK